MLSPFRNAGRAGGWLGDRGRDLALGASDAAAASAAGTLVVLRPMMITEMEGSSLSSSVSCFNQKCSRRHKFS